MLEGDPLLDQQFIAKDVTQGERCVGCGHRLRAPTPSPGFILPRSPRLHQPRRSLIAVLLGFMEVSLQSHDGASVIEFNIPALSSLEVRGRAESSSL